MEWNWRNGIFSQIKGARLFVSIFVSFVCFVVKKMDFDAIINPGRGSSTPDLGPAAIMVAAEPDYRLFRKLMDVNGESRRKLVMSDLCIGEGRDGGCSLVGPLIGSPYAVLLFEDIVGWGAEEIIFVGWCGAVSPDVSIGDIIVPTSAYIDEGTSRHYGADESVPSVSSTETTERINTELRDRNISFHSGPVWTTDAVFRETREKLAFYQSKDVLAVEMETSALFTVAAWRGVSVGAVLVVSDELSTGHWKKGFTDKRFRESRHAAVEAVCDLCRKIAKTRSA